MLDTIFATKIGMTQAWSTDGKRLAVTRCNVGNNCVIGEHRTQVNNKLSTKFEKQSATILEIGYGDKKLKNVHKPLREKIKKSGFSFGIKQVRGVRVVTDQVQDDSSTDSDETIVKSQVGQIITVDQVLEEGDMVQVQGISKGRGFAGAIKRYGFHGGPKTHGQSDRARAVGSIGAGTDPGRVWKGKKMPGHYGVETKTVFGLVVLRVDSETGEVWLSGPVPGFNSSIVRITKIGRKRNLKLDLKALGLDKISKQVNE